MYKFYNANVLDNYVNDCTIRALSLAEGNSWDFTYNRMSDIAQSQGTMMDDRNFIIWYLDKNYLRVPRLYGTVGETAAQYPNEVLLITMKNHITCSRYGTIYDSFDCRFKKIEDAWIVKD